MSPQPEMISFHGWTRLNESSFLLKVQKSIGFQKCIGNYSKAFGVPLDDNKLQSFAEDMCKCCLREADDVMFNDNDGPLAAALQEVQHYKQKLIDCNLTAMKQIAAMRDGCHLSDFLQEDAVTFHEPLTYMDEEQQKLVIAVVCDKVRQLQSGTAPPSLIEALTRYAEELLKQEEGAGMDELLQALQHCFSWCCELDSWDSCELGSCVFVYELYIALFCVFLCSTDIVFVDDSVTHILLAL